MRRCHIVDSGRVAVSVRGGLMQSVERGSDAASEQPGQEKPSSGDSYHDTSP